METTPVLNNLPPAATPSKDKLFKISLIILGILIVLGLFGNIYLLLKKQTPSVALVIPTPASMQVVSTPTPDLTAGWKSYANDKFGFEMKYPPISEPLEYQSKEIYYIPIVSIEKISLSAIQNVDIYKSMPIDLIAQREVGDSGFKYTINKISVNSYETAQVDLVADSNNLQYFIKSSNKNLIIVIASSSKSKEVIDQILSTFKFLDQVSADQTANWKTYNNNWLSFKYPATWVFGAGNNILIGKNPDVSITVVTKDSTLMNECMKLEATEKDRLVVKRFSRVNSGEMCSGGDSTSREIWVVPAENDYSPGISFRYSSRDNPEAENIFGQILATFEFKISHAL